MHFYKSQTREDYYHHKLKVNKLKYQKLCSNLCKFHKNSHYFKILEFNLLNLFTVLDLINDVAGNERYYPTSAKYDGTTLNIRKTEKNKVKELVVKIVFFRKEKVKVNLLKIKLFFNMLYLVYMQSNFSNLVLKSYRQLCFLLLFYNVVKIFSLKDFNETYSNLFPGFDKLALNIQGKILWYDD